MEEAANEAEIGLATLSINENPIGEENVTYPRPVVLPLRGTPFGWEVKEHLRLEGPRCGTTFKVWKGPRHGEGNVLLSLLKEGGIALGPFESADGEQRLVKAIRLGTVPPKASSRAAAPSAKKRTLQLGETRFA